METSWPVILTVIYLLIFTLRHFIEVVAADIKSLEHKKQRAHPPEDGRIISLLAQYLPLDEGQKRLSWWQYIEAGFAWTEPLAIIYFSFVAAYFGETRPLLVCLTVLGLVFLNNVWKVKAFSLSKKLRLTLLLPAQFIPYHAINLVYVLQDIYKVVARGVKTFATGQIDFPLNLRLPEEQ